MDKHIFIPEYPFIDIPYLGCINQKTKENMRQYYYYVIRYFNVSLKSGRRRYYRLQSPYYLLSSFCELEMRDKFFELFQDYGIDSYSIQSVWLDPSEVISGKIDVREF